MGKDPWMSGGCSLLRVDAIGLLLGRSVLSQLGLLLGGENGDRVLFEGIVADRSLPEGIELGVNQLGIGLKSGPVIIFLKLEVAELLMGLVSPRHGLIGDAGLLPQGIDFGTKFTAQPIEIDPLFGGQVQFVEALKGELGNQQVTWFLGGLGGQPVGSKDKNEQTADEVMHGISEWMLFSCLG